MGFNSCFDGGDGQFQANFGNLAPKILTMTYDGSSVSNVPKFYVNGTLLTTDELTTPIGTIENGTGQVSICNEIAEGRTWNGIIN